MGVCAKKFPVNSKDYKLYEEVGDGVSATVYRALCIPFNEVVAIKVFDLEKWSDDLDGIRREVHTMSLIDHPNVLRAHCSFATGHNLWVVMPYMAGGSCLHIMKNYYPEGFEEPIIATVLFETLKAVVYLHALGHIHRDVKAGNILLDTNGKVKLADFGVSACMFDNGDRQRCRNTFVGTPCWMAPEVMQQLHGYDFKADIWSFGITALELAHGHAPLSKYPPMKVLLMTLQNSPPCLDYERDKRFSKYFREMIAACLVKDPKKRPTSEKLLKHKFFRYAKSTEYLASTLLDGLPPLGERYRLLKEKEADLLLQNKALYEDKGQLSQKKYIRCISAWKFDLEDLRRQAAILQDDDDSSAAENVDTGSTQWEGHDGLAFSAEEPSPEATNLSNISDSCEGGLNDLDSLAGSFDTFPMMPVQAIKGYFNVGDDDLESTECKISGQEASEIQSPKVDDQHMDRFNGDNLVKSSSLPQFVTAGQKKLLSGPLLYENVGCSKRDIMQPRYPSGRSYSDQISFHQNGETNNHLLAEDSQERAVFRRKGRFQVTSAAVNSKIAPASAREKELLDHIMQLQQRVGSLVEELQREKLKNAELEKQLDVFVRKDEGSTV